MRGIAEILGILFLVTLFQSAYALEENGIIEMPFSTILPVIDGQFTSEEEWSDAAVTNFESNGYEFVIMAKHDKKNVHMMFDGIDFHDDPRQNSTSARYQAIICLDTNNDGKTERMLDDVCFSSTDYHEFGERVKIEFAETWFTQSGEFSDKSIKHFFDPSWGFGAKNDPFTDNDHLIYELKIPKENLLPYDGFGLNFRMFSGSSDTDVVQLIDGVIWPPNSDEKNPSTWGTVLSAGFKSPNKQVSEGVIPSRVSCKAGYEVIIKSSNNSPACVRHDSSLELIKRGWSLPSDSTNGATIELTKLQPNKIKIKIDSPDYNLNPGAIDIIGEKSANEVTISTKSSILQNYILKETEPNSGIFVGTITIGDFAEDLEVNDTDIHSSGPGPDDGKIRFEGLDHVEVSFNFSNQMTVGSVLSPPLW